MPPPVNNAVPSRVLLINLNRYDQPYPVYPIGLAHIDGALQASGHTTRIWDARMAVETMEACVADFRPDYVGISLRNIDNVQCHNPRSFVQDLLDCCRRLRAATNSPLILGGSAFSVFPRELFALSGVDYGIHGEGEDTIVRLVHALGAGELPNGLPGLVCRDPQGQVRSTPPAPCMRAFSIDPVHDSRLLQAYLAQGALPGVQTQRGCPLRCCYCTYPIIEGAGSRFRSSEEIAAEMQRLATQGVRYTFIVDSVFNTNADHVAAVCEALVRAKIDMQWECFLRPRGITRDLLMLMQKAGLRHVEFGSDSFSDAVLKRYGKSFSYADIESASRLAHELGLHYSHFIIFGGPGETPETVEETLARARTLPGAFYFGTIGMRIYPGTPLWLTLAPESRGETPADYLVEPRFHLESPFTVQHLHARLIEEQKAVCNWAVGDPPPLFAATMEKLRRRGVRGPMWEYIELLQRMSGTA